MAINKKLIHFKKKENFDTEVANGNILDTSIVFIKDTKQLYTHGQYYSCPYTVDEIEALLADILSQSNDYTDTAVAGLVDAAPDTLNTLRELAEAIQSNQDVIETLDEAITNKADKTALDSYVTLDTEQTITGKKIVKDTTFRTVNTEKNNALVIGNADTIMLQKYDANADFSSQLNIINYAGGNLSIAAQNWEGYDGDNCGGNLYMYSSDKVYNKRIGFAARNKNANGSVRDDKQILIGKFDWTIGDSYVSLLANAALDGVHLSGTRMLLTKDDATKEEQTGALFTWGETDGTLSLKQMYYNSDTSSVETKDITVTINDDKIVTESDLSNYVTLDTEQVITGKKIVQDTTFRVRSNTTGGLIVTANAGTKDDGWGVVQLQNYPSTTDSSPLEMNFSNLTGGGLNLRAYDTNHKISGGNMFVSTMGDDANDLTGMIVIIKKNDGTLYSAKTTIVGTLSQEPGIAVSGLNFMGYQGVHLSGGHVLIAETDTSKATHDGAHMQWLKDSSTLNIDKLYYDTTSSSFKSGGDITLTINGDPIVTESQLSESQGGIPVVNHGTGDTTFALTPNVLHTWGTVSSLTLTLAAATDSTVANYYMAEFVSGSTATTLSLPSTISWQNDISIEANKTYQISILNNCGVIGGF